MGNTHGPILPNSHLDSHLGRKMLRTYADTSGRCPTTRYLWTFKRHGMPRCVTYRLDFLQQLRLQPPLTPIGNSHLTPVAQLVQ